MPKILVNSRARDDVTRIFARIAPDNLKAALNVNNAIEQAFDLLGEHPRAGTNCGLDDPRRRDYRFWPVTGYTE